MPEFVLAVDLDGVCAQHTEAFRRVVARERNVSEDTLPLVRSWSFAEWGLDDGDFEELHRIAVLDYRMFRDIDPMPGCSEALWRLSDAGVWIRLVTHRLYTSWGHRVTVSDTVEWLDRYRIPYRDICFLADKSVVNADAHIEDAPHNITAIRAAGGHVIVYDQPYNNHLAAPRAHDWAEVEEMIVQMMAESGSAVPRPLPGIDAGSDRLERRTRDSA
ncbi:5' nucleotidase, NT5C type [Candidatus Poriferisodalis sp.]|uniref:5' nucleotidase, NT5C type n=1 Tax=Candidatus Poriferisodalis sp. TaxID=3101277 RepID=UPI003B023891